MFDPFPGVGHLLCDDCHEVFDTQNQALVHVARSADPEGKVPPHFVSIVNPPREERISGRVDELVESALHKLAQDLYSLVEDRHATVEEVGTAVINHIGVYGAWARYADRMTETSSESENPHEGH